MSHILRLPLLLGAAFGLGYSLTAFLAGLAPESQAIVSEPPLPMGLAIPLITVLLTLAYLLATRWAGVWKGASLLLLAYGLLIFDKWLFGNFSGTRAFGGLVWSLGFWYGLALVDTVLARTATFMGSKDQAASHRPLPTGER